MEARTPAKRGSDEVVKFLEGVGTQMGAFFRGEVTLTGLPSTPRDGPAAESPPPAKPLARWSAEDVADGLKDLGRRHAQGLSPGGPAPEDEEAAFEAYAEAFLQQGVHGQALASLSIPRLKGSLGVRSFSHRKAIVNWIEELIVSGSRKASRGVVPGRPSFGGFVAAPATGRVSDAASFEEREDSLRAKDTALAVMAQRVHALEAELAATVQAQSALAQCQDTTDESTTAAPTQSDLLALANAEAEIRRLKAEAARSASAGAHDADRVGVLAAEIQILRDAFGVLREEAARGVADVQGEAIGALEQLAARLHATEAARHTLAAKNSELYNEVLDLKGAIRTIVRIRPCHAGEASAVDAQDSCVTVRPPERENKIRGVDGKERKAEPRSFAFDKVHGPASSQADLYGEVGPLVRSVMDGYNVCIFAYGQTGSGKTYTMSGPGDGVHVQEEELGVNFRALRDLFALTTERREDGWEYFIVVEMREIYNEHVRDLLEGYDGTAAADDATARTPRTKDATRVPVSDVSGVLSVIGAGISNRQTSSTAMNERSSRSHCIVSVHVEGRQVATGRSVASHLHLVDLAGSERVGRSQATGDRLKEAQHINKSLSALGDVIAALLEKRPHVPFRNSQLTHLLADSLGGGSKVVMLAQVSPESPSHSETCSTLGFAQRCAAVELGRASRNANDGATAREVAAAREETAVAREEAKRLRMELDELRKIHSSPRRALEPITHQQQASTGRLSIEKVSRIPMPPTRRASDEGTDDAVRPSSAKIVRSSTIPDGVLRPASAVAAARRASGEGARRLSTESNSSRQKAAPASGRWM